MEITGVNVLICLAIGMTTGVVSALGGVGGGIIMIPGFVYFLGMEQKNAMATSLAVMMLTAFAASSRNTINNLVDWKVTLLTALAGMAFAWVAAGYLKTLPNLLLTRLFAVFMIGMGIHVLWHTRGATG